MNAADWAGVAGIVLTLAVTAGVYAVVYRLVNGTPGPTGAAALRAVPDAVLQRRFAGHLSAWDSEMRAHFRHVALGGEE